jgi:hypothetical protein
LDDARVLYNEALPLRRLAQDAWLVPTCHQIEPASHEVMMPFREVPGSLASALVRCSPLALGHYEPDFRVFAKPESLSCLLSNQGFLSWAFTPLQSSPKRRAATSDLSSQALWQLLP